MAIGLSNLSVPKLTPLATIRREVSLRSGCGSTQRNKVQGVGVHGVAASNGCATAPPLGPRLPGLGCAFAPGRGRPLQVQAQEPRSGPGGSHSARLTLAFLPEDRELAVNAMQRLKTLLLRYGVQVDSIVVPGEQST